MSAASENGRSFEVTSGSREFLLRHPNYIDHKPVQREGFVEEWVWLEGEYDYPGGTVIKNGLRGTETVFTRVVINPLIVKRQSGKSALSGNAEGNGDL